MGQCRWPGVEEYWRPRYAVLEHAFSDAAARAPRTGRSHTAAADLPKPARGPVGAGAVAAGRVRASPGGAAELAQLDAILGPAPAAASRAPTAVVISAVSGTAGVGKTALAVHWAHRVADRFPDGQLYVNLRGFDPAGSVMDPAEAVRGFLDALGVPPRADPGRAWTRRPRLYRSLLAGRRMLVVLDNARDAEQVRPLLPGAPGCLVAGDQPQPAHRPGRRRGRPPAHPGPAHRRRGPRAAGPPARRRTGSPPSRTRSTRSSPGAPGCRWRWRSSPPAPPPTPTSRWPRWPPSCATPRGRPGRARPATTRPPTCGRCSPGRTAR